MRAIFIYLGLMSLLAVPAPRANAQGAAPPLKGQVEGVYGQWRRAMISKNLGQWQANTSRLRQVTVKNRIHSERRGFPGALFDLPVAPPDLAGLKALRVEAKGVTAKAVYFGKIDWGVGGAPTNNLLILDFINERGRWKYNGAEFVNLSALPDVRKKLEGGDPSYVNSADFAPSGSVRPTPYELRGPVRYIAKVYVYCPGREVEVMVNKISRHKFQNTKMAEVVIGGGKDGSNEVQYAIKRLPGSEGTEPMAIRVYLLSEVQGVKPITVFNYEVKEKGAVKANGSAYFNLTAEIAKKLLGRSGGR